MTLGSASGVDRGSTLCRVGLPVALLLSLAACDCDDATVFAPRIQVAETSNCYDTGTTPPELLSEVSCIGVQVRDLATGEPVLVSSEATDNPNEERAIVGVDQGSPREFRVNVASVSGPVEVEIALFDASGQEIGRGVTEANALAEVERLPAQFLGRANCGYVGDGDRTAPLPRALHTMIPVGGDILVLGGVTGSLNSVIMAREPEVYRPGMGFIEVDADDFGRFAFTAVDVSSSDEGPFQVRVVGGFDSSASPLSIDPSFTQSQWGTPFRLNTDDLVPQDDVILVYTPSADPPTLRLMANAPPTGAASSGFTVASVGPATMPVLLAHGISGPSANETLSGQAFWNRANGTPDAAFTLPTLRLAPSIALVSDDYVVYGGNVTATDQTTLEATTISRLSALQTSVEPVTVPAGMSSSAFHASATLGTSMLAAGGLTVTFGAGMERPIRATALGLRRITINDATVPPSAEIAPLAGEFTNSFLTVATPTAGDVVLTGGGIPGQNAMTSAFEIRSTNQTRVVESGGTVRSPAGVQLLVPRWGHAVAQIEEGVLLVTGGFGPPTEYQAIRTAEILDLRAPGTAEAWANGLAVPSECGGSGSASDAGAAEGG